jgi:hypothetical protein
MNDWHMILTISFGGQVRACVTAHCTVESAIDNALEALAADPDAERAHVLYSEPLEGGLRRWHPHVTYRRPISTAERQEGVFVCV